MARGNRWANFGQAFNAVYNVGTTIARDFEELQIRRKDDEEYTDPTTGKPLTGLNLERAKTKALADIATKYGDAKGGLAMRMGVEDLETARLNTNYQTDTYDERVRRVGLMNANTESATGLNNANAGLAVANTGLVDQRTRELTRLNDIGDATQESTILRTDAQNYRDANQANAQGVYYGGSTYGASLEADGQRAIAEANLAGRKAEIDTEVINDPNYLAGRLAQLRRTNNVAQIEADLSERPEFKAKMEAQLETDLNNAMAAAANSVTDLQVAQDEGYQANRLTTGLAQGATDAANAQSGQLTAERELQVNAYITEWSKTADPNDPTSMPRLVRGLMQFAPETAMALQKNYGEHELWRITSDSLRLKAGANNALSNGGVPGLEKYLEDNQFGGNPDAVRVERGEDGSVKMTATGPNGTYTISEGKSEREFMENLQGYLDPATMLQISKQQYDNVLTRAQASYYQAQANAKGTLSLDEYAVRLMQSDNPQDREQGIRLAYRSQDESVINAAVAADRERSLIDRAGGGNGNDTGIVDPLSGRNSAGQVTLSTGEVVQTVQPQNGQDGNLTYTDEQASANVLTQLLRADLTPADRRAILEGNRELLQKMKLYQPQAQKLQIIEDMAEDLKKQDFQQMFAAIERGANFMTEYNNMPLWQRGLIASGDQYGTLQADAMRKSASMEALQDPRALSIIISNLRSSVEDATVRTRTGSQNSRDAATEELTRLQNNIAALEQQLAGLSTGLSGGQ